MKADDTACPDPFVESIDILCDETEFGEIVTPGGHYLVLPIRLTAGEAHRATKGTSPYTRFLAKASGDARNRLTSKRWHVTGRQDVTRCHDRSFFCELLDEVIEVNPIFP